MAATTSLPSLSIFNRTARNIGLYAVLGILGLIIGGTMIATAAGLLGDGPGSGTFVWRSLLAG